MTGLLRQLARAVITALSLLAAIGVSGFTARRALASPELRVEGRHFRDAGGGVVVLRGVTHEAFPVDNVFELAWDHVPSAGTTEIFLPRIAFFGTNDVAVVSEGEGLDCVLGDSKLSCTSPVSGSKRVIVRSSGPVDGGPSSDDVATRDADAPETSLHPPEGPSSAGCACTLGRHDPSRDAGIPAALLVVAVAAVVAMRWSPRGGRHATMTEESRRQR